MRILVTGGAGFIGSNFIRYWLQNHPHDEVVNFDALTYAGNLANLADIAADPEYSSRYRFIRGDICDREAVREAMRGIDIVAHFAANSHVDRSIVEPDVFVQTNVIGTQILLDEAMKANVWRFHHVSTDEVYGSVTPEGSDMFTEESRYQPNNPYSASKAGSDCIVRAYFKTYGFPATITNTSNNFGPYQFPEKYIPMSISRLMEGKTIRVHGQGDHVRDWLYVEDHCRAIEMVLRKGKMGDVYLVAGHAQLPILEVARRLCKVMGISDDRIEFVPDRPANDKAYKLNWQKIQTELGWEPLYSFDEWLQKTVDWYANNESWWRPLVKTSFAWGSEKEEKSVQVPLSAPAGAFAVPNGASRSGGYDGAVKTQGSSSQKTVDDNAAYGDAAELVRQGEVLDKPITFLEEEVNSKKTAGNKTVLIFGRGQLSMHYEKYYQSMGCTVAVIGRPEVDISNYEQVKNAIATVRPHLVINAAGVTNVDWSEANKEEAYKSNVVGADTVGRAVQEAGIQLVHISSGCVHHCETVADVRTEDSAANPLCYYSATKVEADKLLLERETQGLKVVIVRPRQLLSAVPHPKNVLAKMLVYSSFHDNPNSMTVIEDLVWVTDELVRRGSTGLYNVVNPGVTSPYKVAQMIKEVINPDMQVNKISKDEIDAKYSVKRADAVLSIDKLNREGIFLVEINQRLRQLLTVLRDNLLNESAKEILAETKALNDSKMAFKKS